MQDNADGNWLIIIWEAIKILCGIASAAVLWIVRGYAADRRAIKKNAEDIQGLVLEAGLQKAFRQKVDGGPFGEDMKAVLRKNSRAHKRLHARITKRREEHEDLKNELAEKLGAMEAHLAWLCKQHGKDND